MGVTSYWLRWDGERWHVGVTYWRKYRPWGGEDAPMSGFGWIGHHGTHWAPLPLLPKAKARRKGKV